MEKYCRSLQTLNSAVYDLKEEMKMQLREKLSTSQEVAVILDVIQICSDKYLGICANFYDPEDTTLKTVGKTFLQTNHTTVARSKCLFSLNFEENYTISRRWVYQGDC